MMTEPARHGREVIQRLVRYYGSPHSEELIIVALGLIAGTIGNVCAAVSIAIADFFAERDKGPLIDKALQAARSSDRRNWQETRRKRIRAQPTRAILGPYVHR